VSWRQELAIVAALALAALLVWALVPTYPNYDAYYHLVWGRELIDGVTPSIEAYKAPTQHPLFLALAALLGVVAGADADRALVLVTALSLVAVIWAVLRLGRAVFGLWPGIVAAALTGSSFALLLYAARAYVDIPFLALVLWAAVLEAERPRRGVGAMALLVLAGLLRPEAWVLAGLLWLWHAWPGLRARAGRAQPAPAGSATHAAPAPLREAPGLPGWRPDLLALALLAPALWALVDLLATGDPAHSLNATSDLAGELGRERGLGAVPGALARYLADVVRAPVLLAAVAGIVLAWRRGEGRSLHVPLALLGAGLLTFVVTGAAGLSILPRYLTVAAVTLTLPAGYALAGWASLERGSPARRTWAAGVALLALAGVAFVAARTSVVERFTTELRYIGAVHDDLEQALESPALRAARRCGPVTLPNYRLVPDTRWILDAPREDVGARSAKRREQGAALFYTDRKTLRRFGFADGASPRTNAPDPGFELAGRHGRIAVYVACP
jgi:hypothetical protein